MPEIKSNFSGGRMDKDQDERILPSNLYREALNVTVSNSEDSNVGSVQNLLSNVKVTEAISGPMVSGACLTVGTTGFRKYFGHNKHIAAVIDPQNDKMYRFVTTTNSDNDDATLTFSGVWMDRIVEYDTTARKEVPWWEKEKSVVVDIWRVDTKIVTITHPTCGGSVITVCKNAAQIRHNMALLVSQEFHARVVSVSHVGTVATITLDKDITALNFAIDSTLTFVGDRNLNFDVNRSITAINVIDNMLFWTDNYSEPKKINIKRSKMGSDSYYWSQNTKLGSTVVPFNTAGFEGSIYSTTNTAGVYTQGHSAYSDFDQHTLLVVEDEIIIDSDKLESNCPVIGCMDSSYTNYNPWATLTCAPLPDCCGSLIPAVTIGCMDPAMFNYNASATTHCISCCVRIVYGCIDQTASNYKSSANTDDGSCTYAVSGCTDPSASNYDPAATSDDGSCTPCIFGCMDNTAINYDSTATCASGSCTYATSGCTDPTAINYNPLVTTDDGSCVYCVYGCTDDHAANFDPNATCDDGSCSKFKRFGCIDPTAANYDPNAVVSDGSCYWKGCTKPTASNYGWLDASGQLVSWLDTQINQQDDGSCIP